MLIGPLADHATACAFSWTSQPQRSYLELEVTEVLKNRMPASQKEIVYFKLTEGLLCAEGLSRYLFVCFCIYFQEPCSEGGRISEAQYKPLEENDKL